MHPGRLPESVRRADGSTDPFEPERITRSLFEAARMLGRPDAFLARELTDSVLHFLCSEAVGSIVPAAEIAEAVVKIVRELGHPALARAFEVRTARSTAPPRRRPGPEWPDWFRPHDSPAEVVHAAAAGPLEALSLSGVFPPELVSAHQEGLIRLTGLDRPLELAGVAGAMPAGRLGAAVRACRLAAGEFVALDGPEYDLAGQPGDPDRVAQDFLTELYALADLAGLKVILNLNCQTPPPRLSAASGPLFHGESSGGGDRRGVVAQRLAELANTDRITVWWHLSTDPSAIDRQPETWLPEARRNVEFVFDRPRWPVALGPGITRDGPAALAVVGINLARLVELAGGPGVEAEVVLQKVGSLARFAKTVGHVRQDFLRKHGRPEVRQAFLLDRAQLVLVPVGLAEAARASDRNPPDFARDLIKELHRAVEADRPRVLPFRIDSPLGGWGGLGLPEPGLSVRAQVRAASMMHAVARGGRLDLPEPTSPDDRLPLFEACGGGFIARLRFYSGGASVDLVNELPPGVGNG